MSHSTAITYGTPDQETFQKFFESWLVEQNQNLRKLISTLNNLENNQNSASTCIPQNEPVQDDEERVLRPLINQVLEHYEHYYRAKSRWEKNDVLAMLSPSWRSTLEDAFLWIGGWRPSLAFHLLYSKAGIQFEARFWDLIQGLTTGDLGDLSASQLTKVDELQRNIIREEKKITEKMAKLQETVADRSMVELSHIVTTSITDGETRESSDRPADEQVQLVLKSKEEGLEDVLHTADDLRLRTLKGIIDILNPTQAVHFLIAAAELHLRLHDWGKKRDTDRHHRGIN